MAIIPSAALVFDLDDTLFPERDFVLSGFQAVGDWLETNLSLGGFADVARAIYLRGERARIFDLALAQLKREGNPDLIAQLVRVYREHQPSLSLHPDARWALEAFRSSHKTGLLTDGYLETQRRKVASLGLDNAFDAIVYTDTFGRAHWKPSPQPYRTMMERLGCPGNRCAYVGDNPAKDFVAANALGWQTIQIEREDGEYREVNAGKEYQAQHTIRSLFELEGLMRILYHGT